MAQFQILLAPVFALMALAFLLNVVLRRFYGSPYEQMATGTLFGVAIVIGMSNPIVFGEGLIFDTRTLLVGAATVFAGPVAGLVALGFGLAARVWIGGAGMLSGIVGLLLAYAIALAWQRYVLPRMKRRVLGDVLFGITITTSAVAIFTLPVEIAVPILQSILPVLLICDAVGMAAIGFIYRREIQYYIDTKLLEAYARTDPLTGTLNRRGLDTAFSSAAHKHGEGHALLYFDIDNFKGVNDTYGHDAGDRALTVVAERISRNIREEAMLARHGGDEFSVYIPGLMGADVQRVADRLCRLISDSPIKHKGHAIPITISMGGCWTEQSLTLQDMIDGADLQLMVAKEKGKNRAEVAEYTQSTTERAAAVA